MERPTLVIASRNRRTVKVFQSVLRLFIPGDVLQHALEAVVLSTKADLHDHLSTKTPARLRETMVLLDICGESDPWSPGTQERGMGIAAEMVLSYPEVYFLFLAFKQATIENNEDRVVKLHVETPWQLNRILEHVRNHAAGFRTIFDATTLRSHIKEIILTKATRSTYLPLCNKRSAQKAAIAEEEPDFLYLNGYAAYKYGFSVRLLGSHHELERSKDVKFDLLLTDIDLAYEDAPELRSEGKIGQLLCEHLFKLKEESLPDNIVIVSSYLTDELEAQIKELIKDKVLADIRKPYGGFSDLFGTTELAKYAKANVVQMKYPPPIDSHWEKFCRLLIEMELPHRGAKGSESSPEMNASVGKQDRTGDSTNWSRHSAPYAFLSVAQRLISRASRIESDERGQTIGAVHAAILAIEAKELLGGLSRTTCLTALAVQHRAEAAAELTCYGTTASSSATARLNEIESDAGLIIQPSKPCVASVKNKNEKLESGNHSKPEIRAIERVRRARADADLAAELNFLSQIVGDLRSQYARAEQVDAADRCLVRLAWYQHRAASIANKDSVDSTANKPSRFPYRQVQWIGRAGQFYTDVVTGAGTSVQRLGVWSLIFIILFAAPYWLLMPVDPMPFNGEGRVWIALWHSTLTFIEIAPGLDTRIEESISRSNQDTTSVNPAVIAPPPSNPLSSGEATPAGKPQGEATSVAGSIKSLTDTERQARLPSHRTMSSEQIASKTNPIQSQTISSNPHIDGKESQPFSNKAESAGLPQLGRTNHTGSIPSNLHGDSQFRTPTHAWKLQAYRATLLLEIFVGVIHVGLLIAVLYRKLRRAAS